jgi:uncharacterized RDD family membrane protein YckC
VSSFTTYGEPIVTGEAVAVELRVAGIGSRGVAFLIDFAAQIGLFLLLVLIANNTGGSFDSATATALVLVLQVGVILGYPVGFETLWRGRTPGKAAMGVRVVRDDGGPIRFRHAFVRGLVGVVVDRLGLSFGLLALIPMLVSRRAKRLGDFAAGTIVVQERVPSRVPAPPAMPAGLEPWAAGLDLTGITDALALEIRQFLGRAQQLSPWVREQMGQRLLAQVSAVTAAPPPGVPPWYYLSAVLAERRRREVERLRGPEPAAAANPAPAGWSQPAASPSSPPPPAAGGFVPPA